MKAFCLDRYGDPETVLKIIDTPKPTPQPNEVLVKIEATAVNDYDWCNVTGTPFMYRFLFGLNKPKSKFTQPGMEMAGRVEVVGGNVVQWKVGDRVYADTSNDRFGTFAEYICLDEKTLHRIPAKMDFTEAASISHASMLAYQGLITMADLQEDQKILINGAGGGVGTFAIQIAKQYGVEVSGVDAKHKLEMLQELGYDHVIDYQNEDFTKNGIQYDLILDCKTNRPPWHYARSLRPKGIYVTVGGKSGRILQLMLFKPLIKLLQGKRLELLTLKPNINLDAMHKLFEEGKLSFNIDGPYTFDEIPSALNRFGRGDHKGKVIIKI